MNPDPATTITLIDAYLARLFPLCRSLTGDGNRQTLRILSEQVALNIHEIPCGETVFDWTVPEEWNITEAWIKNPAGDKVVDFADSNLHVLNYSTPIRGTFSFAELRPHLHTLPARPKAIPYRTSYYKRDWGFCLSQAAFDRLDQTARYEVLIDSSLNPRGSLTLADQIHRGSSAQEILLSTYCCHPSLANDNLSGLLLSVLLFRHIAQRPTRYTYRLVVVPETIGVIAYLARFQAEIRNVIGGAVITTVGGPGNFGLKSSFDPASVVERAARLTLEQAGPGWIDYPFVPDGSDERQYSSPGFRIPTITICKDKYYEYPEYHTSDDNLVFMKAENLFATLQLYVRWFECLEMNAVYRRTNPHGEYQLGKRGLFPNLGGSINQQAGRLPNETVKTKRYSLDDLDEVTGGDLDAIGWIMFGCDGETDLVTLAKRSKLGLPLLHKVARRLQRHDLLTLVN